MTGDGQNLGLWYRHRDLRRVWSHRGAEWRIEIGL